MRSTDDRSSSARIRDAAIVAFAAHGVGATTIRQIAAGAGVSPGLVIHHFGSKDNLRVACDKHVAAIIRTAKGSAMEAAGAFDVAAVFRSAAEVPVARYLARTLVDGSPHVAELVDEIVADAVEYLATGEETGLIEPSDHDWERAAILTIWGLGALVLHEHLERLIGVDLTADAAGQLEPMSAYGAPAVEIYSRGVLTEKAARLMADAFASSATAKDPA